MTKAAKEYLHAIENGYFVQSIENSGPTKRNISSSPPGDRTKEINIQYLNRKAQENRYKGFSPPCHITNHW